MSPAVQVILVMFIAVIVWAFFYIRGHMKNTNMEKELASKGYKYCGTLSSGSDTGASIGISSDGDVYLICRKKTYPIEITELSRVSHNARLLELDISYNVTDGSYADRVFSGRIKGKDDELRTYQSRLGWTA